MCMFKYTTLQILNLKIFRLSKRKVNMRQEKKKNASAQPSRLTDRKSEIPPVCRSPNTRKQTSNKEECERNIPVYTHTTSRGETCCSGVCFCPFFTDITNPRNS